MVKLDYISISGFKSIAEAERHEFEALLFSDCNRFSVAIGKPELRTPLQAIRDRFSSPEEINDSAQTAPSKRIQALVPKYQKPIYGVLAALEIGMDAMRKECPNFGRWLDNLEKWPRKCFTR